MKRNCNIFEKYLDDDKQFYDYGTSQVQGTSIFDETKTGTSFYDEFLTSSGREYLRNKKNLVGSIVYMSPEEYYEQCGEHAFGRKVSVENLKAQRSADKNTLAHLKDVLMIYKKKFPMPYINYAEKGQEGLHRMYVAGELFGWDSPKHPVLVIKWADEDRHTREVKEKQNAEIERAIEQAVKEALNFRFIDIEDFRTQLEFELDRTFEFIDKVSKPVKFDLKVHSDTCIISVAEISYTFPVDDIKMKSADEIEDSDIDLDDVDLDDIDLDDEFLLKYLK